MLDIRKENIDEDNDMVSNNTLRDIKDKTEQQGSNEKQIVLTCHLCDYETYYPLEFNEHGSKSHGIIHCDKCDYSADDSTIMKKHMMKHTGKFNSICSICGFEATREALLEDHKEVKHKKNNDKLLTICEGCDKSFPFPFLLKYHFCFPEFKFGCLKCTFIGISMADLLAHVKHNHVKCDGCD